LLLAEGGTPVLVKLPYLDDEEIDRIVRNAMIVRRR
jgi:hypothetical protein